MPDPTREQYNAAVRAVSEMYGQGTREPSREEFNQRVERHLNETLGGSGFVGGEIPASERVSVGVGRHQSGVVEPNFNDSFGKRYGDEMTANAKEMGQGALDAVNPMNYLRAIGQNKYLNASDPAAQFTHVDEGPQQPPDPRMIDRDVSRFVGGAAATEGLIHGAPKVPSGVAAVGRNLEKSVSRMHPQGPIGVATRSTVGPVGRLLSRAAPPPADAATTMMTDSLSKQRTAKFSPIEQAPSSPAPDVWGKALAEERATRAASTGPAAPSPSEPKPTDLHKFSEDVRSNLDRSVTREMRGATSRDTANLGELDTAISDQSKFASSRRRMAASGDKATLRAEENADQQWSRTQARSQQTEQQNVANSERDLMESVTSKMKGDNPARTLPADPPMGKGEPITRPGGKGKPPRVTGYRSAQPPRTLEQYDAQVGATASSKAQPTQRAWSPETSTDNVMAQDVATKMRGEPAAAADVTPAPAQSSKSIPDATQDAIPEPGSTSTPVDVHHPQSFKDYVDSVTAHGGKPVGMAEWSYSQEGNGNLRWSSGYPAGSKEAQQARKLHVDNAEARKGVRPERRNEDLGAP